MDIQCQGPFLVTMKQNPTASKEEKGEGAGIMLAWKENVKQFPIQLSWLNG